MKAAIVGESGIKVGDTAEPKPKPNEVLIKVRACGMNRADAMVASGMAHGRDGGPGTIPGIEYVGEVVDTGNEVANVKPGDRVMCTGTSGWGEYAVADWGRTVPIPANNMTWAQASTLPVALQTMHNAIVTAGRFQRGESIMIQGASTGVGLMGMQIAKRLGAKLVVGSSTNPERRGRLGEFGADLAVDSRDDTWVDQVLNTTGGNGLDLIVDQISGYTANANLAATRVLGRIVNVGRLGGFSGDFNFDLHAQRRINYVGVTFRTRTIEEVRDVVRTMQSDLWSDVEAGTLKIPIDREFALDDVAEAVEYMKANKHFGKIVLSVC
tara:strand:- start:103 stop:1077 length:975 start_codon:yes stop_codon:yes gene_type:complete